jgi:16S rRNA (adenine1518-N6/adenine1519-N6)-dimethyltransferase
LDEFFFKITRALFQHKRKKAKKALLDSYHEWAPDKKVAREMLSRIDPKLMEKRPFQMHPENIIKISMELKILMAKNKL